MASRTVASPELSIIIPTLNAGPGFARTLKAVQAQEVGLSRELVIIDSGSTDETLLLAHEAGARIMEMAGDAFHHARTRNLAGATCVGRYLVFLVQDAVPASCTWLAALADALRGDIIGAYSAQRAREEASPLSRRLVDAYQQSLGIETQRLARGQTLEALDADARLALCRFDNVSSIMLKSVWQEHPFPEVDYAEDVAWACEVLKAGHALRRVPESVVLHSHERPTDYVLRREYVQERTLGTLFGGAPLFLERDAVGQLLQFASPAQALPGLVKAMADGLLQDPRDPAPVMDHVSRVFRADAAQRLLGPDSSIPCSVRQWLAHEVNEDWIWRGLRLRLAGEGSSRLLRCLGRAAPLWREQRLAAGLRQLYGEAWFLERASYKDLLLLLGAARRHRSAESRSLERIMAGEHDVALAEPLRRAFLRRVVWHWPGEYPDALSSAMEDAGSEPVARAIYEAWRMAGWLWDGVAPQDGETAGQVMRHALAATAGRMLGQAACPGGEQQVREMLDAQLARGV